ncbi:MAG: LCP family protein [Candidatus Limnocylindrales bacterium]
MSKIADTWKSMAPGRRLAAVLVPVIVVAAIGAAALGILGGGGLGGPGSTVDPEAEVEPTPQVIPSGETAPPLPPEDTPSLVASPTPAPTPPGADPLLGTDGRLTILLLGSDYRPAHPGNRTDAIIVVSVDPTTGRAAAFSIPRDTQRFPLPGGKVYNAKVNGLYQSLQSDTGHGGAEMKKVVGAAYNLEIDNYAFIGFAGFKSLVSAVGGVDVTLEQAYYDKYYWVNNHTQGWGLPKGTSHLSAAQALIFARSRKGDSDFGRARRQQQLIMAVLDKVRRQGVDRLPKLLAIAADTVRTDLPLNRAKDIFDVVSQVDLSKVRRVVFGPRRYTVEYEGGWSPDLEECRAWIKGNFPAARPNGAWPADPSPAPAASPQPSGSATR